MPASRRPPGQPALGTAILVIVLALAAGVVTAGCSGQPAVPDAELEHSVLAALNDQSRALGLDPRLVVYEVDVAVSGGVVTLGGPVSEARLADAFIRAARQVPGVRRVYDQITVLPDPALGTDTKGIVAAPVADLGDAPGQATGHHRVTQAFLGMVVDLLQERHGWYRVRMPDRYLGWIDGEDLVRGDAHMVAAWQQGSQARVTSWFATVHREPSAGSPELTRLVMGTVVPAPRGPGDGVFVPVLLPDGREGYVPVNEVRVYPSLAELHAERGDVVAIVGTAGRLMNVRYLWGGTSVLGFDCSGFTQFVYAMNGYALPRDADMQYAVGEPVTDRSQLKIGDLVFFSTYKAGPSHVGIYLGNGRFINAADTGVVEYSFTPGDKDYNATLASEYVGARRVITSGH